MSRVNASSFRPRRDRKSVFGAIQMAVDDGIIVVEAGANCSVDLAAVTKPRATPST